jgi:hypothetical protein
LLLQNVLIKPLIHTDMYAMYTGNTYESML